MQLTIPFMKGSVYGMKMYSTSELRRKEVVNVCDGKRIGCATDFEFDPCSGKITALVIPGECGFFGIGAKCDIIIPWGRVECFGEDTVLVRLSDGELSSSSHKN